METMQDYTIYCTEEQARRADELGAPLHVGISNHSILMDGIYYLIPTTQQMIAWLREEKQLHILITYNKFWYYDCLVYKPYNENGETEFARERVTYTTYKEAELKAIGLALYHFEKGGTK